jgi:outer membrane autotransporter protein
MNTVNTAFLLPSSAFVAGRSNAQPGDLGGGVWGRAVVGSVETKSATSGTIDVSQTHGGIGGGPSTPNPGSGKCRGVLHENFAGYQFGFDLATLNIARSGANLHFGLTAGYFESRLKDITPGANEPAGGTILFSPPGSFRSETQVPFLGLYAVFTQGNFFADAQVRQDFYLMRMTDAANGLSDQSQLARGFSVGGGTGYKIPLPSNWFVEPSAGVLWSRVQVDPITTLGAASFNFENAGSVKIDDIESLMGRLSLRVGTAFTGGSATWQPFVTGTVFREFAANATATSQIAGPDTVTIGGITVPTQNKGAIFHAETTRIGTFGQVGVGTSAAYGNWLSYGRFDYKFGENVEGWNLSAGVRYTW